MADKPTLVITSENLEAVELRDIRITASGNVKPSEDFGKTIKMKYTFVLNGNVLKAVTDSMAKDLVIKAATRVRNGDCFDVKWDDNNKRSDQKIYDLMKANPEQTFDIAKDLQPTKRGKSKAEKGTDLYESMNDDEQVAYEEMILARAEARKTK